VTRRAEAEPSESRTSEETNSRPGGWRDGRRESVEIVEVVLLSVVTILTAWAGYSAAAWSTHSRLDLAHASTLRVESNRALGVADTTKNFDASTFNTWFIAYTLGNKQKMLVAQRRFRPAFQRAFRAWIATDPEHNPHAPPGPTYMPQYRQPARAHAAVLGRQADQLSAQGDHGGQVADNYVRISLVLASVLFLVGVGSTFKIRQVRWVLTSIGALVFLGAMVLIATQPAP
jgi:hypothetical protein